MNPDARVPEYVKQNIIAIARDEDPKKIAVLQLAGKYQNKFQEVFRPEAFGFGNTVELLKRINQVQLFHDEMLSLWFFKYKQNGETALLAGPTVPENVKQNIIAIVRAEHPKKISVLQLAGKYQQRFKKEFRPEAFGFRTAIELLREINQVELFHDEMLSLWFIKLNPYA